MPRARSTVRSNPHAPYLLTNQWESRSRAGGNYTQPKGRPPRVTTKQ
jgi:hypothetical protein